MVLESGHGVSQLVPIYDDFIIDNCTKELGHVSGVEIDSQIEKFLSQSSLLDIRTDRDTHLFREFKTKFGTVPQSSKGQKNEFFRPVGEDMEKKDQKLGSKFLLKVRASLTPEKADQGKSERATRTQSNHRFARRDEHQFAGDFQDHGRCPLFPEEAGPRESLSE